MDSDIKLLAQCIRDIALILKYGSVIEDTVALQLIIDRARDIPRPELCSRHDGHTGPCNGFPRGTCDQIRIEREQRVLDCYCTEQCLATDGVPCLDPAKQEILIMLKNAPLHQQVQWIKKVRSDYAATNVKMVCTMLLKLISERSERA